MTTQINAGADRGHTDSIEGMQVRVGAAHFVLPLTLVRECVELPPSAANARNRNFLNIRGDLVPFVSLRDLFHTAEPPDPHQKVVIVSSDDGRVGLMVDQIVGNVQTAVIGLSSLHGGVEVFTGATLLPNGTVALILAVDALVDLGQALDDDAKQTERAA